MISQFLLKEVQYIDKGVVERHDIRRIGVFTGLKHMDMIVGCSEVFLNNNYIITREKDMKVFTNLTSLDVGFYVMTKPMENKCWNYFSNLVNLKLNFTPDRYGYIIVLNHTILPNLKAIDVDNGGDVVAGICIAGLINLEELTVRN